jgi:hypothetical protein
MPQRRGEFLPKLANCQALKLCLSRPIRNVPILSYLEMSPFFLFIFVCCFCRWNAS